LRHDDDSASFQFFEPIPGGIQMKPTLHFLMARLTGLLAALAVGWMLLAPAHAAALSAADEKNVRAVVQGQLTALARDDARKAFSYAAPNVRETVGTAEGFLALVRRSYPVVYRPASVAFLKPESLDDQVIQRVQMTDDRGDAWLAIYSLQRQKDKAWRITGCQVVKNKGRMA
jgi:hypothetical protein